MSIAYDVPLALATQIASGDAKLFNAIVKSTTTGQILGHVQQSKPFAQLMSATLDQAVGAATSGFSPLSVVTAVQNQQMLSRLSEMQSTLGVLQNLQVATLAVSGINLGVSVVGFALVLKRLNAIDGAVASLAEDVARVTEDRRMDEIRSLLSRLKVQLAALSDLQTRTRKQEAADRIQAELATLAGELRGIFRDVGQRATTAVRTADLDLLWTLAAAIRLAQEASLEALFRGDELRTARAVGARYANEALEMTAMLSPDALSRVAAAGSTDDTAARHVILPRARALTASMREAVLSVAAQSSLAGDLIGKGVAGPDYMGELDQETERPLLFLPA